MTEHVQIDKIRPWHEQVVDYMLQNPHHTQGDCAHYFDKTEPWLSTLINTDLFREYKARRFGEHQDRISHSVIERVSGLAGAALEVLQERIVAERATIPLGIVKDSAELMLKSLGYGPKPATAQTSTINLNLYGAPPKVLAEARDDLRRLHTENTPGVEDAEEVEETMNGSPPQLPLLGETGGTKSADRVPR